MVQRTEAAEAPQATASLSRTRALVRAVISALRPYALRAVCAAALAAALVSGCVAPAQNTPTPQDDPVLPTLPETPQGLWSDRWISPSAYAHYIEARVHADAGRLDEAIANADLAAVFDESSPLLRAYHAELLVRAERYARARAVLDVAFELDPDNPHAHTTTALLALGQARWADALKHATAAIERDPEQRRAYDCAVAAALKLKDPARAQSLLEARTTRWPDDPEGHRKLGDLHMEAERYAEAAARFKRVVALRPRHTPDYHRLGEAQAGLGALEEAYATYADCTALKPDVATCWLQRVLLREAQARNSAEDARADAQARVLDEITRMADALAHADAASTRIAARLARLGAGALLEPFVARCIARNPDARALYHHVGLMHTKRGDQPQAIAAFERVPPGSATFIESRAKLAILHSERGQHAAAIKTLGAALREAPDMAELWLLQAALWERRGDLRGALGTLEAATQALPDHRDITMRLATVAIACKRSKRAQAALEGLLARNPSDVQALHHLGALLADQGEPARAEALILKALRLRGQDDPQILGALGRLYLRQGRNDDAAHALARAVALRPTQPALLERLAQARHALGQDDQALALYQRALEHTRQPNKRRAIERAIETLNANPSPR